MRHKRSGSAYLLVLGAVTVLIILSVMAIRGTSRRAHTTRFMSSGRRAETTMESIVDFLIARIKAEMNDPDTASNDTDFYHFFRIPARLQDGGDSLHSSAGRNYLIDVSDFDNFVITLNNDSAALAPVQGFIDELGNDNFAIEINITVAEAEAFTSNQHEVAGISEKVRAATGDSAKFLDSISPTSSSDGVWRRALSAAENAPNESTWSIDFNLPSLTNTDTIAFNVDINVFGLGTQRIRIEIELVKPGQAEIEVNITALDLVLEIPSWVPLIGGDEFTLGIPGLGLILDLFNPIFECDLNELAQIWLGIPEGETLSIESVRRMVMPNSDSAFNSLNYFAEHYKQLINDEYSQIQAIMGSNIDNPNDFGNVRVVEKGGILAIEAIATYTPRGPLGETINRRLVAHMPFKVSDVHPIAPEYTFFVANSDTLSYTGGTSVTLQIDPAAPIDPPPTLPVISSAFKIHNFPQDADGDPCFSAITGFNISKDDHARIPGMVRVNSKASDPTFEVKTFLGTASAPYYSSLNALALPGSAYRTIPVFQWGDSPNVFPSSPTGETPDHIFEMPVILSQEFTTAEPIGPGLIAVKEFFLTAGITVLTEPTLLYGHCHMEYPIGIGIEGDVNMVFSRSYVEITPSASFTLEISFSVPFPPTLSIGDYISFGDFENFEDQSDVTARYEHIRDQPYTMTGHPTTGKVNSETPSNWPANLYCRLQYAKKAEFFFENSADFFSEMLAEGTTDTWDVNGVIFINEDFIIDRELRYTGVGKIVSRGNIEIMHNVTKVDDESVLTLVARGGGVDMHGSCTTVAASVYSDLPPSTDNDVSIIGNLVVNSFDRSLLGGEISVYYDSAACRTSPMSVMRDVGRFAPSRYRVSMPENWSRFGYEKD